MTTSTNTNVSTITPAQYHMLLGLQLVATNHWRAIQELERAALQITQEKDDEGRPETMGCTSDMMSSGSVTVNEMMAKMGITVVEEPKP